MNDLERNLIRGLAELRSNDARAIVLQTFIAVAGPLSEDAGEKVRAILSEERTSAHEGSGAET